MTQRTQGLVLAVLAVVLIRLAVTGEYLRFVTPWMRWPMLGAGLVLLAIALRPALGRTPATGDQGAPRSAWLLLLPTLLVFAVAPPPLGAFLAERRSDQPAVLRDPIVAPLPESPGPVHLSPGEFAWGVSQTDDPMGIAGRRLTMSGFVSNGNDGEWFLTRLEISCCAADARVTRVRISGPQSPPRDQWVEVTGTWLEGTGRETGVPAALVAEHIVEIDSPSEVYG